MFDSILEHVVYATNGGRIRSAITLFPPRRQGQKDFRIWNSQLISYACYRNSDGSIMGDAANIDFTEVIEIKWGVKFDDDGIKIKWRVGLFIALPFVGLEKRKKDPVRYSSHGFTSKWSSARSVWLSGRRSSTNPLGSPNVNLFSIYRLATFYGT